MEVMLTSTDKSLSSRSFMTAMVMSACSSRYSSSLDMTSTVILTCSTHAATRLLLAATLSCDAPGSGDRHGIARRNAQPILASQKDVKYALFRAVALELLGLARYKGRCLGRR